MITPKLLGFAEMARSAIRDISPTDNLISLRLRTRQKEVMVVAPKDGIRIIAIQKINLPSQTTQSDKDYHDNFYLCVLYFVVLLQKEIKNFNLKKQTINSL
jgi:hypothetical protein